MDEILRTPDEQFANLPAYMFEPRYISDLPGYQGLRLHYLDQGPPDAQTVFLCLHGQPTWSYLYRKMIPIFTKAGHRAIAVDLFGFGRSDKPSDERLYTFLFHRELLLRLIERLDLRNITLVCQDWGGLLGLTLPPDMPHRLQGLLVMNTMFGTGDVPLGDGFLSWRAWSNKNPDMNVAKLISRSCSHLSVEECLAYSAPFPEARYKAGVRRFPNLVPDRPDAEGAELSRRARTWWETEWNGEALMAVGEKDPVLGPPVMAELRTHIRGCPPPFVITEAGHFVPEWGEIVARQYLKEFD
jgi:haloalkane dehalogenase/tRNA(adenine34) deaminase